MNYIFVNIAEDQDYEKWISEDSEYFLVFLVYSRDRVFHNEISEYINKQNRVIYQDYELRNEGKYKNNYNYIREIWSKLTKNDYYYFPDPDLEISIEDINELFKYARENKFQICQPSLTKDSLCSYQWLKTKEDSDYRKVEFVEVMMPLFSYDALVRNLWIFNLTYTSYGCDFLWGENNKCVVIDRICAKHSTIPDYENTAPTWGFPHPQKELELIKKYYLK